MRGVGGSRPGIGTLAGALGFVALAAGCSGAPPPGNAETDRIAEVVSRAISYPRQDSAAGYARAALATRAGQAGTLRLVAIEELKAGEPTDPLGRLVFLVHLERSESGFVASPAVSACYAATFHYYGAIGSPRRIACPRGATPVTPPPTQPKPEVVIPDGADEVVGQVLTDAAPVPRADDVRVALVEALGKAAPGGQQPAPQVATDGADIGVALAVPERRSCLLGARIDGKVQVWRPSRVQLQPGELSCDPATALARQGTRPPH